MLRRAGRLVATTSLFTLCALATSACGDKSPPETERPRASEPTVEATPDPALRARMETLARRVDQEREALGIPGLALVVVKDDQVVLSRGFGDRDVAAGAPVDEDTLFAIGSTTKAFTAMLVMMAVDEGKLSLDDHPRACVPYFKLKDEKADAAITVRDLLTHSSGLMRTDLGWYTGALSTEEAIRLAGEAEPTAALRERFQYQNVMYAAAGVCVENALGKPYAQLLEERIFAPLDMTHGTNASVAETLASPQRAVGYTKAGPDEALTPVPMRPIDNIAPAGAINSSLRDIASWLRLMLAEGERGDQRLVSEDSFRQLVKKQQKVAPSVGYTLGWGRDRWRAHRRLSHTGGIDGFVTLISLLPKEGVGFALFTNIQNADIHGYVTEEVFSALLDESWGATPEAGEGADALPPGAEREAGRYGVVGGLSVDVTHARGALRLRVPKQPEYELIHLEGRKYRLGAPAPSGFYASFRPGAEDPARAELVLEQPGATLVLPALRDADFEAFKRAELAPELAALVGVYAVEGAAGVELEIGLSEGRVALLVPGQSPAPLVPREPGVFGLDGLPADFRVELAPAKPGEQAPAGLTIVQPGNTTKLTRKPGSQLPKITAATLLKRMRKAAGARALAKRSSIKITSTQRLVNQGLTARRVVVRGAANTLRDEVTLQAFGRDIGTIMVAYDGARARERVSFIDELPITEQQVNAIRLQALFDPLAEHPELFEAPVIQRAGTIGEEPTIVFTVAIKTGGSVVTHVSTKSWRILKQELSTPMGKDGAERRDTLRFADYRRVGGVWIPHTITSNGLHGEAVETVEKVEFDVPAPGGVDSL